MKKIFEGLSLSSIVAGTLAAVTSFLLASKIGIGGSAIGAAASYVVSAVVGVICVLALVWVLGIALRERKPAPGDS